MALITLRRNFCHLSDFRIHGALAALRNHPINHVHKVSKEQLHPWFCSVQYEPFRIHFHHACYKKFHLQNGNELHPVGEPAFSQGQDWNKFEQNLKNEDEQIFYRKLNEFTSSEEVLSFIKTLETLPDAMAAGALQRICEVEKKGEESHLDRLSMAQLTQLFLTSVLECPFYKGPKLFRQYQVKSFLTPCCSLETPVDFHLYKSVMIGLIDLLGARSYFASKVLTPYCYTIDVEIKLDEEGFVLPFTVDEDIHKRVALCIDGPKRFCSNSKHLLGREAIKQRHLRLLGYQVVQVPYHEIEVLKSRQELVEYLQNKLFPQNSTVHW
ncbi:FAST kinase domain-containing protein 3, mitochondrial isoform X2 [Marmota marmota marmota]|uniref:FAST kinase domain-containing protein 3, mitochondrial isoform X2 n=1 Tax=Marmota marmota marmota TaxID=9994 RepID=UPI002093DA53|nr:FAST kinase domain-containing protein 3, mitochondrial isoform X2 [Marmota marmota marmota]